MRSVSRENPRLAGVIDMAASLEPSGRMAVVLDTGAVSRGSGNRGSNRERDIRQTFDDAQHAFPGSRVGAETPT